jgi:pimeloyl-ACP methyl ester carboxylesterase
MPVAPSGTSTLLDLGSDPINRPEVEARRNRRRGRIVVLALVVLLLAAVAVEAVVAAHAARRHPPPGEVVTLPSGRTLHLDVTVRGDGGPTFVLEAGAGLPSSLWRPTVDALLGEIDGPVTIVAYDRAGSAWSGASSQPPHLDVVVADLHEALALRNVRGPYVLVGHSIGGHYARAFAASHPDQVVGLVLVDPRHEDLAGQLPALAEMQDRTTRMLRWGVRLRPLGITRLVHQPSHHLPTDLAAQVRAVELHRAHLRGALELGLALDVIDREVATRARDLGDLPIRILSAGRMSDDPPLAAELLPAMSRAHQELTGLSSSASRHLIEGADHLSIITNPDHARGVARHAAAIAR